MTSARDSCCRKHFNKEWMWRPVTNRQQIKRCGVTALLFLRHYRHQVAPELQQHNHVCLLFFCASSNLVLFLFSLSFFLKLLSTLFSSSAFFLSLFSLSLSSLANYFLLLAPSPRSVSFSLSFFLALLILCTCAASKDQRWVTLWEIPSPSSSLWQSGFTTQVLRIRSTVSVTLVFHTTAAHKDTQSSDEN